mmetsp:Transcript_99741/g.228920  ORF Transcript_99741/g.228920 Transcript_99741/m.228920 type:complete len:204 (+) Transcript_99741:704-1315(+)
MWVFFTCLRSFSPRPGTQSTGRRTWWPWVLRARPTWSALHLRARSWYIQFATRRCKCPACRWTPSGVSVTRGEGCSSLRTAALSCCLPSHTRHSGQNCLRRCASLKPWSCSTPIFPQRTLSASASCRISITMRAGPFFTICSSQWPSSTSLSRRISRSAICWPTGRTCYRPTGWRPRRSRGPRRRISRRRPCPSVNSSSPGCR